VRVAASRSEIKSTRLAAGEANLVVGCDLIVSASVEAISTMRTGSTRVAVNTEVSPTIAFAKDPNWSANGEALLARIRAAAGDGDTTVGLAATQIATALIGDAIASGMFLLGYVWQRGWLPVSADAMRRAIELNGVAVESNTQAFLWGRRAAANPHAVDEAARPSNVVRFAPMAARKTADLIAHRAGELTNYQNADYARRYTALIDRVAAAEARFGTSDRLTRSVARNYYKLLAYKDEFEVARLYASPKFLNEIETTFEGKYKLHFHLGAWPFAKRDANGAIRKGAVGAWALPAFKLLARLRGLRGTFLDPFRGNDERRRSLRDIAAYERDIERMLAEVTPARMAIAVAIADLPTSIRGYGPVRERTVEQVLARKDKLWDVWHATEQLAAA
jgi:indolepyruvate ferredoxin oxidoreductase